MRSGGIVVMLAAMALGGQAAGSPAPPGGVATSSRPSASSKLRSKVKRLEESHLVLQQELQEIERLAMDATASEQVFSIYGFIDISFQKWWVPDGIAGRELAPLAPTFVFGNLNTYFDFKPLKDWRVLGEVRFLLNPVGDTQAYEVGLINEQYSRQDVRTNDPVNFGEGFEYGSIEIERAVIQYRRLEWLNITVGLFLTPYGIWNIDHGSPTRVLATAPPPYVFQLFPERQLGLKLHGSLPLGGLLLRYALTLSNGRGAASNLRDPDWDKAYGGRVALGGSGRLSWELGVAWYTGRYSDFKEVVVGNSVEREITVRYHESSFGADLQAAYGPLELQWELMASWRNYDDGHRPTWIPRNSESFIPPTQNVMDRVFPGTYQADFFTWATIGVLSYKLPFAALRLRPFFSLTWLDIDDNETLDNMLNLAFGINWRLSGAVVFKIEHQWSMWPNRAKDAGNLLYGTADVHRVTSQLAVAF